MTRLAEKLLQPYPDRLFTAEDLAVLVPASGDARHSLLKRALAAGELLRIRRGLYALAPQLRRHPVDPFAVAERVYGPSYVSMESALSYHGWIPEAVHATTCACLKKSRSYDTPLGFFRYVRIPQRTLFAGVTRQVVAAGEVVFMASPLKALADYVHCRKVDWTGPGYLTGSLRIEGEALAALVPDDFAVLEDNYRSGRVRRFLSALRKELGL